MRLAPKRLSQTQEAEAPTALNKSDTVGYLTRDHDVTEASGPLSEDEVVWTAQRSSPVDLGLL
jgi:hypothetical protein